VKIPNLDTIWKTNTPPLKIIHQDLKGNVGLPFIQVAMAYFVPWTCSHRRNVSTYFVNICLLLQHVAIVLEEAANI
jgi:hypothetical protein